MAKKHFDTEQKALFSDLRKGEYFRFEGKKKVYRYDGGGKMRGFDYHSTDDCSMFYKTKKNKAVIVGITY